MTKAGTRSSAKLRWMLSAKNGLTTMAKPMPWLKTRSISASSTSPSCWSQEKTGGTCQLPRFKQAPAGGKMRQIVDQAAARDVRQAADDPFFYRVMLQKMLDRTYIDARWLEQNFAHRAAQCRDDLVGLEAGVVEDDFVTRP